MHKIFCNAVGHGQYVQYTVKSLPLKHLVILMHLSPLITTSVRMKKSPTVDMPGHKDQPPVFNSIKCPVVINNIAP